MAIVTDEDRAARGTWCAEFMVRFGCNEFIGQPCFVVPLPALDELFAAKREAEERAGWAARDRDEAHAALREAATRFSAGDMEAVRLVLCDTHARSRAAELARQSDAERDALRERVREVQHAESKRHAELESRVAKYEYAFRRAREWTERHDLKATWALDPSGPFWSMTSKTARTALAELIDERDAARAELLEAYRHLQSHGHSALCNEQRLQDESHQCSCGWDRACKALTAATEPTP